MTLKNQSLINITYIYEFILLFQRILHNIRGLRQYNVQHPLLLDNTSIQNDFIVGTSGPRPEVK